MLPFNPFLQPTTRRLANSIRSTTKAHLAIRWKKPPTQCINSLQTRHTTTTITGSTAATPTSSKTRKRHRLWTDAETSELVEYVESTFVSSGRMVRWETVSNHLGFPHDACRARYTAWKRDRDSEKTDSIKLVTTQAGFLVRRRASILNKQGSVYTEWSPEEIGRLRTARGDPDKRCNHWESIVEYVGNGRTKSQCQNTWRLLRRREKLLALQTADAGAASDKRPDNGPQHGRWTRDEIDQLTALCKQSSGQNARFLTTAARNLFPHKPPDQVGRKLQTVKAAVAYQMKKARILEKLPELEQVVRDYGGVEKTDWRAVAKVAGVPEYECSELYRRAFLPSKSSVVWSHDEIDRLVRSLYDQRRCRPGYYDWHKAAADVGTRKHKHCFRKFHRDPEIGIAVGQMLSSAAPLKPLEDS
ncbi:hypothetical protein H4217_003800 [Coemansia sp. RSA 1939]|nr:hypothetical protein H4217_003800 [Coemansia sp. RSA 1939]KAJ2607430.1 hypothetical protein EV177_005521 [Coemansia sp. RSA 1804]